MSVSYVVTGASGFVGRHLIECFARKSIPVIAVARRPLDVAAGVKPVVVGDYSDTPIQSDSVVIHLAESANVADFPIGELAVRQVELVLHLLERRPNRFVYLSSGLVYGDETPRPHQPDEIVRPVTPYAAAKVQCEKLVLEAGGIVLRAANLYGRRMAPNTVMSDIIRQLGRPDPITVRSAGPIRDYLWIDDAAEALARAAASGAIGCYNVGSGVGTSVGDLILAILAVAGESNRSIRESAPAHASAIVLDVDRTRDVLGWQPETSLEEGLRRLIGNRA